MENNIQRQYYLSQITYAFTVTPIVAILGARQCGKTTLSRYFIQQNHPIPLANYFDLEDPDDLARLMNPKLTLMALDGMIVIDKIQKKPDLFPLLRVLVDNPEKNYRFLILGSASKHLIKQSSESLAGRISYLELTPLTLFEVTNYKKLLLRGGFPPSYLAQSDQTSYDWRQEYIRTFLEQDIPALGIQVAPENLRRFWMMLTHYHGCMLNTMDISSALGINHKTVRHYVDILAGTFMIRLLLPWYENISKRQVKTPKIYFRDSGLYYALTRISSRDAQLLSPKLGISWEGFALEQIICSYHAAAEDCYFWATHNQAEIDLLVFKNGKRIGFEIKYTDSPKTTKSMHIALHDLALDELWVVYPGVHCFPLADKMTAIGLQELIARCA